MRVLFFGNNWLAWQVVRWLRARNETIVGLAVHMPNRSKHRCNIIEAAGVEPRHVFDGVSLRKSAVLDRIRSLKADIGVSVLFGHILCPALLDLFPGGCINLHPSLLPHNRGAHPNVWSILDGSPAGVTLHYMDAGIDTGDIVAQREIPVLPIDTGETLYRRLELAALELFTQTWPTIAAGNATHSPQPIQAGSTHRVDDLRRTDEIDLKGNYKAQELIDLLRARTFPPFPGAYFRYGKRKVFLRLSLAYGGMEDEN